MAKILIEIIFFLTMAFSVVSGLLLAFKLKEIQAKYSPPPDFFITYHKYRPNTIGVKKIRAFYKEVDDPELKKELGTVIFYIKISRYCFAFAMILMISLFIVQ